MDSPQSVPPIPPPHHVNMDKLIEQLFDRMTRLEIAAEECHNNHRQTLELQNGAMVRILEQNTRVLENIDKHLSSWQNQKVKRAAARRITR